MARHAWIVVLVALAVGGRARAEGTEQLMEILDLHEKLATSEAFQHQAKLLGAYMEAAQSMSHDQRVLVYQRVLGILRQIERAPVPTSAPAPAEPKPPKEEPAAQTSAGALRAGAAHLEWYDAKSLDKMPEFPVRRGLWTRDLMAMGESEDRDLPPVPDGSTTVRISFFFEAGMAGKHRFSAQHGANHLRILVSGKDLLDLANGGARSGQGEVRLEKGYHRVDVLLRYEASGDPSFAVSVLHPGDTESRVVTKSDLLLTSPVG